MTVHANTDVDEIEPNEHRQSIKRHEIFAENVDTKKMVQRAEQRREGGQ